MTRERDHWKWNPLGPMHQIFSSASRRRELLLRKQDGDLTPEERRELEQGYPPYFYLGTTFFGHAVQVSKSADDGTIHTFIANNPMKWAALQPALSTRNWPQGPPDWVKLTVGVHYPLQRMEGDDMPEPWDVAFQRQLDGNLGTGTGR